MIRAVRRLWAVLWTLIGVVWLVSGGLIYNSLVSIQNSLTNVIAIKEPASAAAFEMEINVIGTGLGVLKYVDSGDPQHRERVLDDEADFVRHKAEYDAMAQTPRDKDLGARIGKLYEQYRNLGDTMMVTSDEQAQLFAQVARGFERIDEIIDDRLQARFDPRAASGSAKIAASTDLEADVAEVGTWLGNYLRTPDRDYRERIFDNLNDCRRGLARFKRLDLTPEERRWTTELETRFNEVASGTNAVLARHESQRRNEATFYALRNALDDLLDDEIQAEITKDLAAAKTEAERTVMTAHRASLVLLGIGLLVGAWAASITIRRSAALEALNAELQQRIEEGRRTQELLRKSTEQLRALSARLESIQEDERTKIAREIHDVLGQALTSLMLDISWLDEQVTKRQPSLPADRISGKLRSVLALAEDTIETVRRIAMELRPALLDDFGLVAAVEWQTQDFEERTGIPCQLSSRLREASVSTEVSTATFRILQETLANVARHAKASMVAVLLEEKDGHLILKVEDNGRGARADELSDLRSLGVLGMRERAALLGGEVEIAGAPGKGTTVTVKIPLQTRQDLLAPSGDSVAVRPAS